jgi:hypothetical protein
MQPDADLLHPLPQRIPQHGLGPGLGRQCTRRQAVCEAVGGRLSAARSWRSSSKAAWLETPRRARSASRVIGCPCWSWYSAAARREREQGLVLIVPGRDGRPGADSSPAPPSLPSAAGRGVAGGAALDHGDRDEERGGRDGSHDPAPGGRLRLGEVGGQAQQYPAREHDGGSPPPPGPGQTPQPPTPLPSTTGCSATTRHPARSRPASAFPPATCARCCDGSPA